jgi:hypothetical protein
MRNNLEDFKNKQEKILKESNDRRRSPGFEQPQWHFTICSDVLCKKLGFNSFYNMQEWQ